MVRSSGVMVEEAVSEARWIYGKHWGLGYGRLVYCLPSLPLPGRIGPLSAGIPDPRGWTRTMRPPERTAPALCCPLSRPRLPKSYLATTPMSWWRRVTSEVNAKAAYPLTTGWWTLSAAPRLQCAAPARPPVTWTGSELVPEHRSAHRSCCCCRYPGREGVR